MSSQQNQDMTDWTSVSFEKEFIQDLDEYIAEASVFQNRKEFLKHAAQNEMNRD